MSSTLEVDVAVVVDVAVMVEVQNVTDCKRVDRGVETFVVTSLEDADEVRAGVLAEKTVEVCGGKKCPDH